MAYTHTTSTSATAWRPDIVTFAPTDAIPDALVLTASTKGGTVEGDAPACRVAYVDDDDATVVAEGSEIPEAEPELAERICYTAKIAQLVRVSREQWVQDQTATQLSASVSRAITRKADALFLNAPDPAPASAPSIGLLNHSGVVQGGTVTGDLDPLIDLIATLQSNDSIPSLILMGPLGWAQFQKIKDEATSARSLLGAGTNDAQSLLLSLPVKVNNRITGYGGVVIDKGAVISAWGNVEVATSEHAYFSADSVGIRATFRFGTVIVRPDRIGAFDIAADGS